MNTCLVKYLGDLEITQKEVINILKHLLFNCTMGELKHLEKSRELPVCVQLLIEALFRDMNAGRLDTVSSIIDLTVKQ